MNSLIILTTGLIMINKAIYVNTWNHAMSAQVDSNPNLGKKVWNPGDYPTKEGTREDAENDY